MDFRERENFSEDNFTGQNRTDMPKENLPTRVLTAKTIIGDDIDNDKGQNIGSIKDIMLNMGTGCSEYVVMATSGILGFGKKYFAIPFEALRLDDQHKKFILHADKEIFDSAPGFDKDHWPETNSRHYQDVKKYWTNVLSQDKPY